MCKNSPTQRKCGSPPGGCRTVSTSPVRCRSGAWALTGFAAGIAGAIQVSRISLGQPQAGLGMELQAIAAVILGGTSIYGGEGAVWRSVAGVMVLALINNGFNILNADPFWKDWAIK